MHLIQLTAWDLALASAMILLLAGMTLWLRTGQTRILLIASVRTFVQLLLVGLVLKILFDAAQWYWVAFMGLVMLLVAGYEVSARQKRRFRGWWGYGLGTFSMFIAVVSVLLFSLALIVQPQPWYLPQYFIPLLGMLLGNCLTGIALALDRLTEGAWVHRQHIEARMMLGLDWNAAIRDVRAEAMRSGLMPIINSMAAAGVVSLPGMMTGQILAGVPPMEAVKYQILLMFLITSASGIGSAIAVWIGSRRLFDARERLMLNRLASAKR